MSFLDSVRMVAVGSIACSGAFADREGRVGSRVGATVSYQALLRKVEMQLTYLAFDELLDLTMGCSRRFSWVFRLLTSRNPIMNRTGQRCPSLRWDGSIGSCSKSA